MPNQTAFAELRDRFHHPHYLRHNARRLEHLASLQLPIRGRSVLEVGAGIGDLSSYFLDRDCRITITEPRKNSLEFLRNLYPNEDIRQLDLDVVAPDEVPAHEVVFCYGVLYHLADPENGLTVLSQATTRTLLLETCVTPGDKEQLIPIEEDANNPTEATAGRCWWPTRSWIHRRLCAQFPHVYQPMTQPAHPDFPLDWRDLKASTKLTRAIFIASRTPLQNPMLREELLEWHHPMS